MPQFGPILRNSPEFDALAKPMPTTEKLATPEYPEGFTFKDLQEKVKNLSDQFKDVIAKTQKNRLLRDMQVNNEEERQKGRFKPDEIYIPYHVINDNISKESAAYINYLTKSKNAAIFKDKNSAAVESFESIERPFTSAVRYEGYEHDVFPTVDGHQLHGIDYMECKYDESKPGYFSFEQLGYENVWYPKNVQRGKFQATPILVRNCEVTKDELLAFPNVNKDQVDYLFRDVVKNDPCKNFISVQKVSYRYPDGKVWTCWMNYEKSTDFIREPQPLHLGRWSMTPGPVDPMTGMPGPGSKEQIFEDFYPVVPFPYTITENKRLIDTIGRSQLDENIQEAVSSLVSCIINGFHKGSQFMWAPKNPTNTAELSQLDFVWEAGRGLNQPVDFFNHPYPDADGMTLVNALLTQNKAETAQVNLAVGNRQDYASRKTAQEIKTGDQKETELKTVQLVLISTSWKELLNIAWLIYKAQLELGTIVVDGFNMAILQRNLMLQVAGETEVLQRQETLQNLQNLWPIISTTPAAMPVLEDILRLMVPANADKYIAAMQMAVQDDKAVLQGLAEIVTAIATQHPEVIPQESMPQLQALLQKAQQSAAQPQIGAQPNGGQPGTTPNQPGSNSPTQSNPPKLSIVGGNEGYPQKS